MDNNGVIKLSRLPMTEDLFEDIPTELKKGDIKHKSNLLERRNQGVAPKNIHKKWYPENNRFRQRTLTTYMLEDDDAAAEDVFRAESGNFGSKRNKRRGTAAPSGICHSCNRIETSKWRRGPDGAQTLCNDCGLHYATLTRITNDVATAHLVQNDPYGEDSFSDEHSDGDGSDDGRLELFDDSEFKYGNVSDYPSIPGEEMRNANLHQVRESYSSISTDLEDGAEQPVQLEKAAQTFQKMAGKAWKSPVTLVAFSPTISRDNTCGEFARQAKLLAEFGQRRPCALINSGASDSHYLSSTSGISFSRVVFAAVKSSNSGTDSNKSDVRPSRRHVLNKAGAAGGTSMRDSFFGLHNKQAIKPELTVEETTPLHAS